VGVTRDARVEEDSLRLGNPIPWRWAKEPQQVRESLIAISVRLHINKTPPHLRFFPSATGMHDLWDESGTEARRLIAGRSRQRMAGCA
jgi:hypothetical protein